MGLHKLSHMKLSMRLRVAVGFAHRAGQAGLASGVGAGRGEPLILRGMEVACAGFHVITLGCEGIDRASLETSLGAAL